MYEGTGSANHAEYSVLVKPTTKTKLIKFGLFAGAITLFIGVFAILSIFDMGPLMLPSSVMLIVLEVFGIWYFWKYTSIEYDYLIATGDLTVTAVYGGRSRKDLFSVKISTATVIASYEGKPAPEESTVDTVYNCVSSFEAANIVYIAFKDGDGKKCIAYIEAPQKFIKLFKFYNSTACKVTIK